MSDAYPDRIWALDQAIAGEDHANGDWVGEASPYFMSCDPIEYTRADLSPQWQPIDGDTPYETRVLTYWPGDGRRNPLHLINTRNSGENLGAKDGWWYSRPDQMPTHWKHLDKPTE